MRPVVLRRLMAAVLFAGWMFVAPIAVAQTDSNIAPLTFRSAQEEARFHALSSELRCVMCQNQSLADSNAIIARDLRVEVLALMRKGMSDAEIKTFLVQRYGEFVLYRPRMQGANVLLWLAPGLLLLGGGLVLFAVVKRRQSNSPKSSVTTSDEEQEW